MAARPKTFPGTDVNITWDGRLCIHAEECVRARSELFEAGRRPWAEPDRETPDAVSEIVSRCPTGALVAVRKDAVAEAASERNTVTVANDGPLYFRGDLVIDGAHEHMDGVTRRAALCRCGDSAAKPFCDGSHAGRGFKDTGAIGNPDPGNEATGGALEVNRAQNGPLLLSGNFELVTGSGRVAWSGKKAALCRCGRSANKPFCDGSHKEGFEAA